MFKLLELEFFNHPFLKDITINFCGDGEEFSRNYTTLIIGPNGTGKSQILLSIINIFNSLIALKESDVKRYKFPYNYRCKYLVDNIAVELRYENKDLFINDYIYSRIIDSIPLPKKLLVSSYSFNDKYPLRQNRGKIINDSYHYLGLKSTTNNIFIYNPPKGAIDNLSIAILKGRDVSILSEAFNSLGLNPEIKIIYKPGRHFKFLHDELFLGNGRTSSTEFSRNFRIYLDRKKRKKDTADTVEQKRLGEEKIDRILIVDDNEKIEIDALLEYVKTNFANVSEIEKKKLLYKPKINFLDSKTIEDFSNHVAAFKALRDLEIISFDQIEINKLDNHFSFDNASSGEYHILLTFLNLLSLLEENSLVLIDEPEISLHPNWQMQYMHLLHKAFERCPGVHFIVTSHSHFLVSDLKGKKSSIVALKVDPKNGLVVSDLKDLNTYSWSAEKILLEIFEVPTTRNYYVADLVGEILQLMANPDSSNERIRNKISRLRDLNLDELSDNDPLKEIVDKLINKIDK